MVLTHERFNNPPGQPMPAQQIESDAAEASFLYTEVEPPPAAVSKISGERRSSEPADETGFDGLRRCLTIMFGLKTGLTPERFCMEALAAARWNEHQLVRDLIEECDTDGRLLGLRKDT